MYLERSKSETRDGLGLYQMYQCHLTKVREPRDGHIYSKKREQRFPKNLAMDRKVDLMKIFLKKNPENPIWLRIQTKCIFFCR